MKFIILIISILVTFTINVNAQISIETVTTDTIDLFSNQQLTPLNISKSAIWSTLLIPGLGHQKVGKPYSAIRYISIDAIAIFGAIFFNKYYKNSISNYKSYASTYAEITSTINDDYYWEVIGSFNNYFDYHETLDLVRESEHKFIDEKYFWSWQDSLLRSEYVSLQKNAKRFRMVSSFFIGAIILNRVIAFIDIRSTLKNNKFANVSNLSFKPFCSQNSANGIILSTDF